MKTWQLQSAKAHFSELVKKATAGEPQEITLRGKPVVVIVSTQQYEKLQSPKPSLDIFLKQSPLAECELTFARDKTKDRDIEL